MPATLESFASECRRILKADPGPAGREQVREVVQEVLKDETFVRTYLNDNTPDREVIYQDPELGFCICAHLNRDAKEANPHDHGSSWAIYGQAFGETEMSDWEIVEPASEAKPGKVRRAKVYSLKPGMAHLYNESEVHSPKRVAATGLIRIEGSDTQKLKRFSYKAIESVRDYNTLEDNLTRIFIVTPANEVGCSKMLVRGPFDKFNLGD